MSEQKTTLHKTIMIGALLISVGALPFSVKVCHGAMIIALFSWLLEGNWARKFSIVRDSLLLQLITALFLLQLLGLVFAANFSHGWFSLEKKIFFLLLPLVLATTSIKLDQKDVKLIITGFLIACFAGTVICFGSAWQEAGLVMSGETVPNPYLATSPYQELHADDSPGWLVFSYVSLTARINIHPTYFALYLAFCIIFLLHEFPSIGSRIKKAVVLVLVLYFALFIVLLSSRIILLSLAVIFAFVIMRSIVKRQTSFALMAAALAVLVSCLVFANPVTRYRSLEEISMSVFNIAPNNNYHTAAKIRVSLWWLGIKSLADVNPLYGAGTGNVERVMSANSTEFQVTNVIQSFDPHNQFLYTAIANGVPAMVVLIMVLTLPLYWAWIQSDLLTCGFAVLFILVCLTESGLETQKGIAMYSLLSGLLFFHRHSFQAVALNLRSLMHVGR